MIKFCRGCARALDPRSNEDFCCEGCREEYLQGRYEDEIQAGTLESQAQEEIAERSRSEPLWNGYRFLTRSTSREIRRKLEREWPEDH